MSFNQLSKDEVDDLINIVENHIAHHNSKPLFTMRYVSQTILEELKIKPVVRLCCITSPDVKSIWTSDNKFLGYEYNAKISSDKSERRYLLLNKPTSLLLPKGMIYDKVSSWIFNNERSKAKRGISSLILPGIPGSPPLAAYTQHLSKDYVYVEKNDLENEIIIGCFDSRDLYNRLIISQSRNGYEGSAIYYENDTPIRQAVYGGDISINTYHRLNPIHDAVRGYSCDIHFKDKSFIVSTNEYRVLKIGSRDLNLYFKDDNGLLNIKYRKFRELNDNVVLFYEGLVSYNIQGNDVTDIIDQLSMINNTTSGGTRDVSFAAAQISKNISFAAAQLSNILSKSVGPIKMRFDTNEKPDIDYIEGNVYNGYFDGKVIIDMTILHSHQEVKDNLPIDPYFGLRYFDAVTLPHDDIPTKYAAYYLFGKLVYKDDYLRYRKDLEVLITNNIGKYKVINVISIIMEYI